MATDAAMAKGMTIEQQMGNGDRRCVLQDLLLAPDLGPSNLRASSLWQLLEACLHFTALCPLVPHYIACFRECVFSIDAGDDQQFRI